MIHAGLAADGDRCLLFPGRGEAGKSTLVAGLVRAGWRYGSDELALLPLEGRGVGSYARRISIDVGAYEIFPELLAKGYDPDAEQWHVRPEDLAPDPLGDLPEITHILFPLYEPNAPTVIAPLTVAHALHRLVGHAVNLRDHSVAGFNQLGDLAQRCPAATMRSGDLDEQLTAITEWMST